MQTRAGFFAGQANFLHSFNPLSIYIKKKALLLGMIFIFHNPPSISILSLAKAEVPLFLTTLQGCSSELASWSFGWGLRGGEILSISSTSEKKTN